MKNEYIKKIIVTSDTHGDELALENLIMQNQNADMIIHLGDGETEFLKLQTKFANLTMINVKGNCDFGAFPTAETKIVQINEFLKIFACHGHTFRVKQSLDDLIWEAKKHEANLALFGHTHNRFVDTINGLCVLNPGSLTRPRSFKPGFAKISVFDDGEFKTEFCNFQAKF